MYNWYVVYVILHSFVGNQPCKILQILKYNIILSIIHCYKGRLFPPKNMKYDSFLDVVLYAILFCWHFVKNPPENNSDSENIQKIISYTLRQGLDFTLYWHFVFKKWKISLVLKIFKKLYFIHLRQGFDFTLYWHFFV